jgi:hypothetical protein
MKRIFLLTLGILFAFAVKAQQAQTAPAIFTPEVFVPKAVGVPVYGTAYMETVQVNSASVLNAYIYLYQKDVNGNIVGTVKKMVSGGIYPRPSHWPTEFYPAGSYDPQTMKYYSPKPLSFVYQTEYAVDEIGRYILNSDGSRSVIEKITFQF